MARVGRPRKEKSQKVEYQLIAVHIPDYQAFIEISEDLGMKKVEAFKAMVQHFIKYNS